MTQTRSPGYPSSSLGQAIEMLKILHDANRTNPTDREAAAKDMGYSGLTGASAKMLADLVHYGLIEKAGKGGVRVSQLGVDILYPEPPSSITDSLRVAATTPSLFADLGEHFSAGAPSDNSLRSYLVRRGFATAAIPAIMKSFTETARLMQESDASESHGEGRENAPDLGAGERKDDASGNGLGPEVERKQHRTPAGNTDRELPLMEGERVIFMDEVGPGQYLKVVASGALDMSLIEAMEDFTKRRKKRLPANAQEQVDEEDDPDDI